MSGSQCTVQKKKKKVAHGPFKRSFTFFLKEALMVYFVSKCSAR